MKVKHTLTAIGVILSGVVCATGVFASRASAVTFEGHSDVQFTFGSVLTLTLTGTPVGYSDPMFLIDGLMQGTESLSNKVTATVGTNNSAGYTLSATVGGTDSGGTTYSTSELVSSSHTDKFTMIDDTSSSSLSAGEWGFTLSGDAVSPATPEYMTLDTATAKTINATADNAGTPASASYGGTADTDMWIGAYADSSQKAGDYGNVINFTATANIQMRTITVAAHDANVASYGIVSVDGSPISSTTTGSWAESQILGINATCVSGKSFLGWGLSSDFGTIANQNNAATTYTIGGGNVTLTAYCGEYTNTTMQGFTAADAAAMSIGDTRTLKDVRDGKSYTIAKLADGNVWMTENLNLAGGTALSAADTDVTSTYINGFTTQANLTKNSTNNTISLPASSASGFSDNATAYVYNTSSTSCGNNSPCYSYYSWLSATLGGKQANGSTAEERDGYNAAASICPKGWKLPTATTSNAPAQTSPNWKTGDYYKLATAYGANLESNYYENAATFYNNAGPGTTPNFLLVGGYNSGSPFNLGSYGFYWSSSSRSSIDAYNFYLAGSAVKLANDSTYHYGFAIRCILK